MATKKKTAAANDGVKPGKVTSEFQGKNRVQLVSAITVIAGCIGWNLNPELANLLVIGGIAIAGWVESSYSKSRGFAKMKSIINKVSK